MHFKVGGSTDLCKLHECKVWKTNLLRRKQKNLGNSGEYQNVPFWGKNIPLHHFLLERGKETSRKAFWGNKGGSMVLSHGWHSGILHIVDSACRMTIWSSYWLANSKNDCFALTNISILIEKSQLDHKEYVLGCWNTHLDLPKCQKMDCILCTGCVIVRQFVGWSI